MTGASLRLDPGNNNNNNIKSMNRKSISLRQCLKLNDSEEQEGFCWRLSGVLDLCANMHLTCCTR